MCAHHLPSIGEWGSPSLIRILVMDAVRRHPENRTAFKRSGGANRQEILHPFGRLVAAVRQQAMVPHANAQAAGHPAQKHRHRERFPSKEEQSYHGSYMEKEHEDGGYPVNFVIGCLGSFQVFDFHMVRGFPPLQFDFDE